MILLRILKGGDAWKFLVDLESRELDLSVFMESVRPLIEQVKFREDEAVSELVERFYGVKLTPDNFQLSEGIIDEALSRVDKDIPVLEELISRVRDFYSRQKIENFIVKNRETEYGVKWLPLERIGIHVPEDEDFSYFSTLIYTAVPAKIAGVDQIFVFTPPLSNGSVNPYLLAAAKLSGVDRVYRIGGAIAVAAMAYGTTTIPSVQKIFGTGDLFFMTAKKMVSPDVAIDFPSTPVEHVVIAGNGADTSIVAWEVVSQAEHGFDTFISVLTLDDQLAEDIKARVDDILDKTVNPIVRKILDESNILVLDDWREIEEAAEVISPARIVVIGEVDSEMRFNNVGAIIWNTPSPIVDYALGVPQRLPSSRYSRFRGPLTLYDFMRSVLTVKVDSETIKSLFGLSKRIASMEGMDLHANYLKEVVRS